LKSTSFVI
jgi:hypothetical protein